MTKVDEKLDKLHIDFWDPYYRASIWGKTYTVILLDTKTQKIWLIYLQSKDKFVNVFQVWLSKIENKNNNSIKVFRANGGGSLYLRHSKEFAKRRASW